MRCFIVGLFNYKGDIQSPLPVPSYACEHITRLDILSSGKVALCCMDQEGAYSLGDVNNHSVLEVFRGEESRRYQEMHRTGRRTEIAPCGTCNLFWPSTDNMPFFKALGHAAKFWAYFATYRPIGKKARVKPCPEHAAQLPDVSAARSSVRRPEKPRRRPREGRLSVDIPAGAARSRAAHRGGRRDPKTGRGGAVSRRIRIIQLLFFLAALAALLWLLNKIGWSSIGQALLTIGPTGAVILLVLGFSETIFDSAALAIAIGQRRSGHVLFFNSAGALLNQILPFDLGEVVKGGLTHRMFPSGKTIAGTIVWNYVFKISRPIVTLAAALIGLAWATSVDVRVRYLILGGALASFVPYVLLRLVLRRGAAVPIIRLLRFVRILRRSRAHPGQGAGDRRDGRRLLARAPGRLRRGAGAANVRAPGVVGQPVRDAAPARSAVRLHQVRAAVRGDEHRRADHHRDPGAAGGRRGAAGGIFKLCGLPPQTGVIMYVVLRLKSLSTTGALAPFAFLRVRAPAEEPATAAPGAPAAPAVSGPPPAPSRDAPPDPRAHG